MICLSDYPFRAGATGLNAAVLPDIVSLSWRYLPTVLASSLIMLGWALIINNLGRRRYPIFWWHPESKFLRPIAREEEEREEADLQRMESGRERDPEIGSLASREEIFERLEGEEGN